MISNLPELTARSVVTTSAIAPNLLAGAASFPALLGASQAGDGGIAEGVGIRPGTADQTADRHDDALAGGIELSALAFQTPDQLRFAVPSSGKTLPQSGSPVPPPEPKPRDLAPEAVKAASGIVGPSAARATATSAASPQPLRAAVSPLNETGPNPEPVERTGLKRVLTDKGSLSAKLLEARRTPVALQLPEKAQGSAERAGPASVDPTKPVATAEPERGENSSPAALPKADPFQVIASLVSPAAAPAIAAADAALRVTLAQDALPRFVKGEKALGRSIEPPARFLAEAETTDPVRIADPAGETSPQSQPQGQTIGAAPTSSSLQASATLAQAAPPLSGPATALAATAIGADPRGEVRPAQALDAIVNQLSEAREMGRAARPEMIVRHHEFGAITMRIEAAGTDLRATLSSRDPGFVPAIQAALSERAAAIADAPAGQSQRGQEQGANGGSNGSFQSGTGGFAERNYGSSPGSGQGSSQPYRDQSSGNENKRDRPEPTGSADGDPSSSRDTGLFA